MFPKCLSPYWCLRVKHLSLTRTGRLMLTANCRAWNVRQLVCVHISVHFVGCSFNPDGLGQSWLCIQENINMANFQENVPSFFLWFKQWDLVIHAITCLFSSLFLQVWDYVNGVVTSIGVGHCSEIKRLRICPHQKYIISVSKDGAIFRWKYPSNCSLWRFKIAALIWSFCRYIAEDMLLWKGITVLQGKKERVKQTFFPSLWQFTPASFLRVVFISFSVIARQKITYKL